MKLGTNSRAVFFKKTFKALFLLTFLTSLFIPIQAHAASSLNDKNVRDFIMKTSRITEGHEQEMDQSAILKYLDKHLEDKARFKSSVQFHVPGFPSQETTMTLDKEQFMAATAESAKSVGTYEGKVQILSIKISTDKRSAVVETKSKEEVMVPITQGEETQEIPVEGDSVCTQTIMLSKKGVIQMFSAQCVTDIAFIEDGTDF